MGGHRSNTSSPFQCIQFSGVIHIQSRRRVFDRRACRTVVFLAESDARRIKRSQRAAVAPAACRISRQSAINLVAPVKPSGRSRETEAAAHILREAAA